MSKYTARSAVNGLLDGMPYGFVLTTALVTAAAILSLLLVDVITGAIVVEYKFKDVILATAVSLATTGILAVVLAVGIRGVEGKWPKGVLAVLFLGAMVIIAADTYLDGMAVDVKTFGGFVVAKDMFANTAELNVHYVLRGIVAGISLIGEPLAAMGIAIFPVIKDIFNKMVDGMDKIKTNTAVAGPTSRIPATSPAFRTQHTPLRTPSFIPGKSPKPTPAASSRPLYNEPTYHPIGMTPRDTSKGSDR